MRAETAPAILRRRPDSGPGSSTHRGRACDRARHANRADRGVSFPQVVRRRLSIPRESLRRFLVPAHSRPSSPVHPSQPVLLGSTRSKPTTRNGSLLREATLAKPGRAVGSSEIVIQPRFKSAHSGHKGGDQRHSRARFQSCGRTLEMGGLPAGRLARDLPREFPCGRRTHFSMRAFVSSVIGDIRPPTIFARLPSA
jgi:hypothetical protein